MRKASERHHIHNNIPEDEKGARMHRYYHDEAILQGFLADMHKEW